jgi:hypothetical protein
MHTVAKPARIQAEKWAVDEAMRKVALRTAKINKVQPSYTSGWRKIREIEARESYRNTDLSGAQGGMRKCSI